MEKITKIPKSNGKEGEEDPGPPIDIDQLYEDIGFVMGAIQLVHDLEDIQHLGVPWVMMEAEQKLKNVKKLVFEPFGFEAD